MLDWARYEHVLFPIVARGDEWYYWPWQAAAAAAPGPKAKNSLTDLQQRLVQEFVAKPGKAKVMCMHAPPIGPYPAWTDADLYDSKMVRPEGKLSGSEQYVHPDGTWQPIYAVQPKGVVGQEADHEETLSSTSAFNLCHPAIFSTTIKSFILGPVVGHYRCYVIEHTTSGP